MGEQFLDQVERHLMVIGHIGDRALLQSTLDGELSYAEMDKAQAPVGTVVEDEAKRPLSDLPEELQVKIKLLFEE